MPGLFQAGVDGMRAWAKLVNKQGGIAGRKVVIDFIDSRLSPDDARNAVIKACAEDFAMVGSEALFLNNVDDMVACKNNHGEGVGLPDLPGLALDPAQRCSPVTYVAVGDSKFCSTRDQNPQTYYTNQGDFRYYLSKQKDLHGIFAVPSDLKSTKDSVLPQVESAVALGDQEGRREGFYDTSARALQSAATPLIQVVKDNNSNFVYNGNAFTIMVHLRKEAKLQGTDSVKFWACNQGCYDKLFVEQGGADVDGTYAALYSLPFYSEYKQNPTLKALVKSLGDVNKMTANGIASWTAALLFQRAAEAATALGATLTRQVALRRDHVDPRLRRRRNHRQDRHREPQPVALRRHGPGPGREARARAPQEAGHIRLRQEEPQCDQARPHLTHPQRVAGYRRWWPLLGGANRRRRGYLGWSSDSGVIPTPSSIRRISRTCCTSASWCRGWSGCLRLGTDRHREAAVLLLDDRANPLQQGQNVMPLEVVAHRVTEDSLHRGPVMTIEVNAVGHPGVLLPF